MDHCYASPTGKSSVVSSAGIPITDDDVRIAIQQCRNAGYFIADLSPFLSLEKESFLTRLIQWAKKGLAF